MLPLLLRTCLMNLLLKLSSLGTKLLLELFNIQNFLNLELQIGGFIFQPLTKRDILKQDSQLTKVILFLFDLPKRKKKSLNFIFLLFRVLFQFNRYFHWIFWRFCKWYISTSKWSWCLVSKLETSRRQWKYLHVYEKRKWTYRWFFKTRCKWCV